MKRTFFHFGVVILALFNYAPCFANATQIIYGFEKAQQFNHKTKKALLIQAASFLDLHKAQQYQHLLQSQTTHPVIIKHKPHFHAVLVGPFTSLLTLKNTATSLLVHSKIKPIKKIHHSKIAPILTEKKIKTVPKPTITTPLTRIPTPAQKPQFKSKPIKAIIPDAQWVAAIGAGEQYPQQSGNIKVNNGSDFNAPYNQDIYTVKNTAQPVVALSVGRRWQRDTFWFPAYSGSLFWQYFFKSQAGNTIMQYSIPEFTNYNYNWNIKSNLLLASAKLNLLKYHHLSPYINGGIGASFNKTSGYTETALGDVTPRVNPGFGGGNTSAFAYQAGAGLDLQFNPQLIISLGYNYQDLGNVNSGSGIGTWSGQSLNLGSFRSNEVLISVNYLFGK